MTDDHRVPTDIAHATLAILFIALLAVSTFWVLSPFLTSILWATVISIATWPLLLRLQTVVGGKRSVAVAIMTALILLVVFVPVTLALITIVDHAQNVTAEVQSLQAITLGSPPAWLEQFPLGGERMTAAWRRFAALSPDERAAELTPYLQGALTWFAVKAGGIGTMLLQFILTAIITAIMLANGEAARAGILRLATRLAGRPGYEVALLAAQTIRAVVLGVVLTALIQSTLAGASLYLAGIRAAGLLTAVILFMCLAQLGPLPIIIPAVIWLFWSDQPVSGTILLVVGLPIGLLDNVLRPFLIKRGANVPLLLIFSGVIGGLIAFGIIGLFIGPVVLTVAYTLLQTWVSAQPEVA